MPFDGMVISAVIHELKDKITNGKIEKIYQPESDEINLFIRSFGKNYKLLISANSNHPRIHFTASNKQNPPQPPMFCMLMRKHLQGSKILNIQQKDFERIILIDIEGHDELGFPTVKQLIVEIMGKHSNIILIDKNENKIIDSIKRITNDVNRYREILPGKFYIQPPTQGKKNPISIQLDDFIATIRQYALTTPIYKVLYTSLQGISPTAAKEICYQANIENDLAISSLSKNDIHNIWIALQNLLKHTITADFTPNIVINKTDHHMIDFYSTVLHLYSSVYQSIPLDSMSKALEEYYIKKDLLNRLKQKSSDLRKFICHKFDSLYHKHQKLQEELMEAHTSQKYQLYGELLTANLHLVKRGYSEIEVINFYDKNENTFIIPLDPKLTPSKNAQVYFKKYNKAKNACKEIQQQIEETHNEMNYFQNLLHAIENVTALEDIEEIKIEMIEEGYLRKRKRKSPNKRNIASKPLSFISSDGFKIFVGKNNKQNDKLTLKMASKKDLWFHTKNIPGSHVIILCNNQYVPENTILEAAHLAAFYSKGKMSSNVPVDYTQVKNVKKPNGAKPGMVIYENNKTLYVTPSAQIVQRLVENQSNAK